MGGIYYGRQSDQYITNTTPDGGNAGRWPLGHRLILPDGRTYAFALNDSVAEVAGSVYQSALPIANHANRSADVARAGISAGGTAGTPGTGGATAISATVGATTAAQDLYMEGYAHINVGASAGEGFVYKIRRALAKGDAHAAFAGSDAIQVNLADGEQIQVALVVTTSKVTYQHHRFRNVVIMATTLVSTLAGVASKAAAASVWYWSQTEGYAAVLTQGTVVVGTNVMPSTTTAGACTVPLLIEGTPNTGVPQLVTIGRVAYVGATATFSIIDLTLGA